MVICSDKELNLHFHVTFLHFPKVVGLLSTFVGLEEHGLFSWALAVLPTLTLSLATYTSLWVKTSDS